MDESRRSVVCERSADVTMVRMSGAWTATEAADLHEALLDINEGEDVVLDLRDTDFVDSTILTEFVALRKRVDPNGGHIAILASDNAVKRILQITNLDKAFSMNRGPLARTHLSPLSTASDPN